jgi:mannose-6-phosphate isomerase-like protein (cupin superfamily)
MSADSSGIIHLRDVLSRIPAPPGHHAVDVRRRGTLDLKVARAPSPPPRDLTPHGKDEIYVIVRGRGVLRHGASRDPFEAGDLLYVAAGVEHRFEDFTDDLAVWVSFYGPEGGEVPA